MARPLPSRAAAAVLALVVSTLAVAAPAAADVVPPSQMPGPLKEVRFDQRIGETLPLDARFTDELGRDVALGDLWGERPVVLAFVYYECPMLCSLVLQGAAKALGVLTLDAGTDFDVVAISIDPEETPALARETEAEVVRRYAKGRDEGAWAAGWHFLSGRESEIRRVAAAAGFHFAAVAETGEWAHAGGVIVTTPDGRLAQYFYGIEYPPKDLRLALVEASGGTVGNVVDQVLLYCFRYDPQLGKYTAVVTRVLRLAGVAFCVALALFVGLMLRQERAAKARPTSTLGAASR